MESKAEKGNLEGWHFDTTYLALPDCFYARVRPVPVRRPKLVLLNESLVEDLHLNVEVLRDRYGGELFSGNRLPAGATPIAQAYAGHQFGHFTKLGDGRAVVLGEHVVGPDCRVDVQLKGSGPTPFARRGDGRAVLGPMLREYIISEAMHALGIPTTRSLAVVSTGERVMREAPLPGAVLTRVAASHIRIGTFQYAAACGRDAVDSLLAFAMHRHGPECLESDSPAAAFLEAVVRRQAALLAQWMLVGFVHGVMNTDNMAISGETIDYGPCAFLDRYDPATVFSSIDAQGRYAFGNQPAIAQWNLARFAETLLPFLHENQEQAIEIAEAILNRFAPDYHQHWLSGMRAKLGLMSAHPDDESLVLELLTQMHAHRLDYTLTFASLGGRPNPASSDPFDASAVQDWWQRWEARTRLEPNTPADRIALMRRSNPVCIPRNHLVEAALRAAQEEGVMEPVHELLRHVTHPYDDERVPSEYRLPGPDDPTYRTFCGT